MRWDKATEAEKKAIGRKLVNARVRLRKEREAKRRRTAKVVAKTVPRRSVTTTKR